MFRSFVEWCHEVQVMIPVVNLRLLRLHHETSALTPTVSTRDVSLRIVRAHRLITTKAAVMIATVVPNHSNVLGPSLILIEHETHVVLGIGFRHEETDQLTELYPIVLPTAFFTPPFLAGVEVFADGPQATMILPCLTHWNLHME